MRRSGISRRPQRFSAVANAVIPLAIEANFVVTSGVLGSDI